MFELILDRFCEKYIEQHSTFEFTFMKCHFQKYFLSECLFIFIQLKKEKKYFLEERKNSIFLKKSINAQCNPKIIQNYCKVST